MPHRDPRLAVEELLGLRRGLQVLEFLAVQGCSSLAAIAQGLQAPRPTIHRVLATLIAEGYCVRIPAGRTYMATPRPGRLFGDMKRQDLLTYAAMQPVLHLADRIRWPLALVVPDGLMMLTRLATDHSTPLALARVRPGYRTPIPHTTTGLLCLAFESAANRRVQIAALARSGMLDRYFSDSAELSVLLRVARRDGFLLLDARYAEGSLGVPLLHRGRPIGGLVMRYIKSAFARDYIEANFLPRLFETSSIIVAAYDELLRGRASDRPPR